MYDVSSVDVHGGRHYVDRVHWHYQHTIGDSGRFGKQSPKAGLFRNLGNFKLPNAGDPRSDGRVEPCGQGRRVSDSGGRGVV